MSQIQNMISDFNHPPTRHAMFVHVPIVLAMFGVPLSAAAAILPRNVTLKVMAIIAYAALVIAAFMTTNSGEEAQAALGSLSVDANTVLNDHEEMASKLWLLAFGGLAITALSALKHPIIRTTCSWFAVAAGVFIVYWVSCTAHLGGSLVYGHGVGVPPTEANARSMTMRSGSPVPAVAVGTEVQIAFFHDRVRPILSDNCFKCHNAARVAAGKSGRLDQTSRETLLQGGKHGPAIVVGKPDESNLIMRVTAEDSDDVMPPGDSKKLTPEQIAVLAKWIRDGAAWEGK